MVQKFSISLTPDDSGYVGRKCPKCSEYFKVNLTTGSLPKGVICPYCCYHGNSSEFHTSEQLEYAKSVAIKQTLGPLFKELEQSFKGIETSSSCGFIQFKVKTSGTLFKIQHYQEKILQTDVTCDNCGLQFSIYGVFSSCPNCGRLNAKLIFEKSIEVLKRKLKLAQDKSIDKNLQDDLMEGSLIGGVSSFDAFGKALRRKHLTKFPVFPKGLFQNFLALCIGVQEGLGKPIQRFTDDSDFLLKMFQVRHIYIHNAGVIDDGFIRKCPDFSSKKGRKYDLEESELDSFLEKVKILGINLYNEVE